MNPGDLKMVGGGIAIFKPNAELASYMVGPDYYTGPCRGTREFGIRSLISRFFLCSSPWCAHCSLPEVSTT